MMRRASTAALSESSAIFDAALLSEDERIAGIPPAFCRRVGERPR